MKPDRPLDNDDFENPDPKNPAWIVILGGLVLLAMVGAFASSLRMVQPLVPAEP